MADGQTQQPERTQMYTQTCVHIYIDDNDAPYIDLGSQEATTPSAATSTEVATSTAAAASVAQVATPTATAATQRGHKHATISISSRSRLSCRWRWRWRLMPGAERTGTHVIECCGQLHKPQLPDSNPQLAKKQCPVTLATLFMLRTYILTYYPKSNKFYPNT